MRYIGFCALVEKEDGDNIPCFDVQLSEGDFASDFEGDNGIF